MLQTALQLAMPVPEATIHLDLAYVTDGHPRQRLDLYLPSDSSNMPLIIMVHGGAWLWGDKKDEKAADFLAQGYAVASINYRYCSQAIFPAQIEDCKAAVRWLRSNAEKYCLDPNRFGAYGSSAGGHLVALLGVTGKTNQFDVGENLSFSSGVQAVADFFGPTDFCQIAAHRLPTDQALDLAVVPECLLVGGRLEEHMDTVRLANPVTHINEHTSPFLVVHGNVDPLVPYHQSQLLAGALIEAGQSVIFYTVKNGGHGGFIDAKVSVILQGFFRLYLL